MNPRLVISLDFELRWGAQDQPTQPEPEPDETDEVVPAIVACLAKRSVPATWAIVGAVACESWEEWRARTPAWPRYETPLLRDIDRFLAGDPTGRRSFAPQLVRLVAETPGHELASHTFSHTYMGERGFTRDDAVADAQAMTRLFCDRWGEPPSSFVFPRNQIAHTDVLFANGIKAYRGNPDIWFWRDARPDQGIAARAMRLLDSFMPISSRRAPIETGCQRASHFVRWRLPGPAWSRHVRRIAADASRLEDGQVLHLWWHPHNVRPADLPRLDELLDRVDAASPANVEWSTMRDVAAAAAAV
jgi:peptidoglycan/xylan/chitin deacetylase (PgdA/CDA1 family)